MEEKTTDLVEALWPIGFEQALCALERGTVSARWARLYADFDDIERLEVMISPHSGWTDCYSSGPKGRRRRRRRRGPTCPTRTWAIPPIDPPTRSFCV